MAQIRYRIREMRKALGISQTDLAQALNIQRHNVSNWERGKYRPTDQHRAALCQILKCKLSDLEVLEHSA